MKKLQYVLTAIIILISSGCEIGLGSAVDTEPPALVIDAGIADKVIRGDFAIRGTYSDDGTIESVSGVLKRTDGTGSAISLEGELDEEEKKRGNGSWRIPVPALSSGITDGTYQADITIKDSATRTTVQSTIFTIDNTKPIIVLTRPSTATDSNGSETYGQKFTIEGQAADTNNISRIEIQLYRDRECTLEKEGEPIVLKNVPLSISMDAASYDSQGESYKYEGETQEFSIDVAKDGNGRQFYCRIYAYDGSSRYLAAGEEADAEDEKGNCVDYFYLYKDIYTPLLQYYKITELYSILNGTYSEQNARAVSAADAKDDLEDPQKYQKKAGSFILNPKNNPTFSVTGRSELEMDGHDFEGAGNEILNGQSVFIEVAPGLDNIPLVESSLKVYVIECGADGRAKAGAAKIYPQTEKEEKGSSYRFNVKIRRSEDGQEGLKIGKTYIFGVEGYDQSEARNAIEPAGKGYGFRLAANGNAPVLTITQPEETTTYVKKAAGQRFMGTVEVELGVPTVLVYKGSDAEENLIQTIELDESTRTGTSSGALYSFEYNHTAFGSTNGVHKFIFKANLEGQLSQPTEKTVVYDVEEPTVSITKPVTAKKFTDGRCTEDTQYAYLNGNAEFTVMLNDKGGSGLDTENVKPKWEIIDSANGQVIEQGIITEPTGQTITIDTTDSKYDTKTIIFRVTASDTAGNVKSTQENDAEYTFKVDQSTDLPYIGEDTSYTKLDFNLSDINDYYAQSGEKKGNVEKGSSLKFKLYEDDGTAKLYIYKRSLSITDNNDGSHTVTNWASGINGFTSSECISIGNQDTPNKLVSVSSYTFPPNDEDCGFYEYAIVAEDAADSSKKTVKGPFIVRITQDKASITVTKDKEFARSVTPVINTVTISPSEGPYKLYRQVVKNGGTYTDGITAESDSVITETTDAGYYTQYISQYKKIADIESNSANLALTDTLRTGDFYSSGETVSDIIVYYKVLDGIGNTSVQRSVRLRTDDTAPAVEIKSPTGNKTGTSALTEKTLFSGTANDGEDTAGVKYVYYKFVKEGETASAITYTRVDASNGPFTVDKDFKSGIEREANKLEEGKWTFYVYAEDDAGKTDSNGNVTYEGNKSGVLTLPFDIDFSVPTVSAHLETDKNKYNATDLTAGEGSFSISGSASDSWGLETLTVSFTNAAGEVKNISVPLNENGRAGHADPDPDNPGQTIWVWDGNWKTELIFGDSADSTAANYLAQGVYKVKAKAEDKAGKISSTDEFAVTIDYTPPVIDSTSFKLNDQNYSENGWYESKTLKVDIDVTDSASGSGISSVQCETVVSDTENRISPLSFDSGSTYTGTAQLAQEGEGRTIKIKAKDVAGNETEITYNVKIDTSAPELEAYKYKIGSGSLKNCDGTVYTNGTAPITVYGTYSDAQSGIQPLSFKVVNGDVSTDINPTTLKYSTASAETAEDSSYTLDITATNRSSLHSWKAEFGSISSGTLVAVGKNNAGSSGLSAEKNLFKVVRDNTYPTFTRPKIEPNTEDYSVYKKDNIYYLNNEQQTFIISGLASDDNGVDKVYIKIENVDNDGNAITDPADPANPVYDANGQVINQIPRVKEDNNSNGNFTVKFRQGENGAFWTGGAKVTITVTDIAGNSTVDNDAQGNPQKTVLNIKFDTEGPKGVHALDSSSNGGKDLYFRVGDMRRDEFVKKNNIGELVDNDDNIIPVNGDGIKIDSETITEGNTTKTYTYTNAPEWDSGTPADETAGTPAIPSKDKDVGGKYSGNTFGNAETVKLRGRYNDAGSGVNLIYYKIYIDQPTSTVTDNFLKNYATLADGYFSPSAEETRRVFYTGDATKYEGSSTGTALTPDGTVTITKVTTTGSNAPETSTETKNYIDITTNYKTTIANLKPGANYIVFVAVDNVGNAALESVTHNGVTYDNYCINVDTEAPTISSSAPATGLFTNCTAALPISGTVSDNPSDVKAGIGSVWVKYDDNKAHWIKATVNETAGTWSASVPVTALSGMTGSKIFTVTATDKSGSGNPASCTTTVTIDITPPSVEITERPSGAGTNADGITQVNGDIKIKATASDTNGLKEPVVGGVSQTPKLSLYYRAKTGNEETPTSVTSITGWSKFGEVENNEEWTLHTPPLATGVTQDLGEGTWFFTVAATDKAENTGYSTPFALEVNKDTDRPVVKFNMPFGSSITSDKTEIDGFISDDDGYPLADKVWYYVGNTSTAPEADAWKLADSSFTYNANSGAFTLKPGDGSKYIWFKIEDRKGQTFTTSTSTDYNFNTPKISDRDGTTLNGVKPSSGNTTTATTLVITTDTTAPETKDVKFTRTPSNAASWNNAISAEQFGGTKNTFYLQQYAFDANGVKKVYLSIPVDETDGSSAAITAWSNTNESTRVKTTVFTNGNQPTTASYCYEDYAAMTATYQKAITSVAANHSTITATVGGTAVTFTREAYIFPLEITNTARDVTVGTNTNTYYLWETPYAQDNDKPVNVANLTSGTRTASLISFDGIRSSSNTVVITIDNTPPVINFSGPSNTNALSGSVTVFGSVDSTSTLSYAVSTSATVSPASSTTVDKWYDNDDTEHSLQTSLNANTAGYTEGSENYKYYQYKQIETANSSLSWFVYFDEDGIQSSEEGEHQQTLNNYLISYGITDTEHLEVQDSTQFNSIVKLYVWIKAEDERGNITEVPRLILLDPQGDRPEIKLSYPAENGKTYGGQIQLSGSANDKLGTADDKVGIESVWMQIIAKKHLISTDGDGNKTYGDGGTFEVDSNKAVTTFTVTQDDLDYLMDKYDIYNMRTYHTETTHTKYSGTLGTYTENGETKTYFASDYAIRIAPEGSSWNQAINQSEEFDFKYVAPEGATAEQIAAAVKTNDVAIRVYAQDKDGKFSVQKDCYMIFDAQNPVVGSPQALYLIQSDDADFGTSTDAPDFKATAYKDYTPDMFVRGQWYLIGSVTDNDAIKTLKIHNDTIVTYNNKDALTTAEITNGTNYSTWTSTDKKTVYFKYKLDTADGVGALAFNIYAEDQASPTTGKTTNGMSIKFDNTAPVIATAEDSSYKLSPNVVQSNGRYRLESKVWENAVSGKAQSGLESVAFYFIRRNTANTTEVDTIYNPMLAGSNTVTVNASVPLMKSSDDTSADGVVYDSGLYWKKASVTRSASLNQLGIASTANHMYIRKGGLVKIGGALYKITERTDTTVTLSGNPPQNETTAYFAIALISDHTTPESGSEIRNQDTGYPATITGDDGDGMVDYVEKSGTAYTWSAEIVSKNIPDGPIELHYVVFDAAGNYSIGIMGNKDESDYRTSTTLTQTPDRTEYKNLYTAGEGRTSNILYVDRTSNVDNGAGSTTFANENYKKAAFVENNAPRLAAVKVWTDYNGDNVDQDEEKVTKYCNQLKVGGTYLDYAGGVTSTFIASGNGKDYKPAANETATGTALMVIRDKTTFTPEIVGGNGELNYKGRVAKADALEDKDFSELSSDWIPGTNVQIEASDYLDTTSSFVDLERTRRGDIVFGALKADGSESDDWENLGSGNSTDNTDPYWFEYQIWDSTEGTTPGINSLYATMRIALQIDYFDEIAPKAVISPFFWNNNTDNSLYNNSRDNGHIELEDELTTAITNASGSDPKVSGKITIRGTAYDNIRLDQLWVKFEDITFTAAEGNTVTGTNPDTTGHAGYSIAAVYNRADSSWTPVSAAMNTEGWSFSATDEYCNKDGHLVNWALNIDTSKVSNGVGFDKNAYVMAVAQRGTGDKKYSSADNSAAGTETDVTLFNKPSYQMDIVPYVSEVVTSLSSFNPGGSKGVYDRTALGHYPVYMTHAQGNGVYDYEIVRVEGFNLAGTSVLFTPAVENTTVTSDIKKYKLDETTKKYVEAEQTDTDWFYGFQLEAGIKSGEISVQKSVASNTISSLNNINSNLAHGSADAVSAEDVDSDLKSGVAGDYSTLINYYNRQPNNTNNNRLSDDLFLDVWDFNSEAAIARNDGKVDDAVMKINPKTGIIGFAFSNGSERFSMGGYKNTSITDATDNDEYSYYEWNMTYDKMTYNNFAYDASGRSYGTTSGGDINADANGTDAGWDYFSFMTDRWGQVKDYQGNYSDKSSKNNDGGWTPRPSNYSIAPEGIGQLPNSIKKDRIQSASIASLRYKLNSSDTEENATHIYLAYYDLLNDEIRFRFCNLKDTYSDASKVTGNDGTFIDARSLAANKGKTTYEQTAESGQIIAANSSPSSTLGNAGNAVALGVTADNTVVVVWYDSENEALKISWNTTPNLTSDTVNDQIQSRLGMSKAGWSNAQTLIPNSGEFCQLVVGGDNSIHVVAYDSSSGDLKYAYVPYNSTSKIPDYSKRKICTVDSYLDRGTQLSLDVVKETHKVSKEDGTLENKEVYIPHIGYWSAYPEKAHYAYLSDYNTFINAGNETVRSGADNNDKYTGIWECGVVPSISNVKEGKINVGLWKETDGSRRNSNYTGTAGANETGSNKSTSSSADGTKGKCYGNGTDNAVLAYVVMPSSATYHIETAQMR